MRLVLDVEPLGRTKDPWGNERAGFTATTTVDRKDFGLSWNQVLEGGVVLGERVSIEIDVEAVKQDSVKAA
jgi:polyisoprenoid-binding protein YceI